MKKSSLFAILLVFSNLGFADPLIEAFNKVRATSEGLFGEEPEIDEFLLLLNDPYLSDDSFYKLLKQLTSAEIKDLQLTLNTSSSREPLRRALGKKYGTKINDYRSHLIKNLIDNFKDNPLKNLEEIGHLIDRNILLDLKIFDPVLRFTLTLTYEEIVAFPKVLDVFEYLIKRLNEKPAVRNAYRHAFERMNYLIGYTNQDNNIVRSPLPKRYSYLSLSAEADIIFNNDGYSTKMHQVKKGNAVVDDKHNNPIGYVIYLPKNGVKNVVVDMYGGNERKDLERVLNRPGPASRFESGLLLNQTAIINLNLPDLLKNNDLQLALKPRLLTEIHDAVDYFYKLLKNSPESIHPDLAVLKNKSIFLMGASFGGMMSIYHAIHFPHTFNGYISHAGGLFGNMASDHESYASYLKVSKPELIKKIQDPIFVHHSLDDNRVKSLASLEFYNQAKAVKKNHLIKLFIDDHGNAWGLPPNEPGLHGHFFPEGYYLRLFLQQLTDFINSDGRNIDVALNEYRYEKYSHVAKTLEGKGEFIHGSSPLDMNAVLSRKALEYYYESQKNKKRVDIYDDEFQIYWDNKIIPCLLFYSYQERLIPKQRDYSNEHFNEAIRIKRELINIVNESGIVSEILAIIKDDDTIPYEVIDHDIKSWLKTEIDENSAFMMKKHNFSMLEFFINYALEALTSEEASRKWEEALINDPPQSYVNLKKNIRLQAMTIMAIRKIHDSAIKTIYEKITRDPEATRRLLEEYRRSQDKRE